MSRLVSFTGETIFKFQEETRDSGIENSQYEDVILGLSVLGALAFTGVIVISKEVVRRRDHKQNIETFEHDQEIV
jgi:hypothetical protein